MRTQSSDDSHTVARDVGLSLAPRGAIPDGVREQVRNAFAGFVGNDLVLRRITNDLLRALIERPPHLAKNYLLTGQPSTGKTELARRIAAALGLPFIGLDGRGVESRTRLFELIDGALNQQGRPAVQVGQITGLPEMDYPPLTVFIDEVHLVPNAVQESLLTMLEAADRTVTLPDRVARVSTATFLFATTRPSKVDAALRTRCSAIQLREYTQEEVAEIVARRFSRVWTEEVFLALAKYGRRVPRIALELAKELETAITVAERPLNPLDHLEEVREACELDAIGLGPLDIEYLEVLEREGEAVGETKLLNLLGTVDKNAIVDEVEPFLRRLNFIRFGRTGRELTAEGAEHILARRRNVIDR